MLSIENYEGMSYDDVVHKVCSEVSKYGREYVSDFVQFEIEHCFFSLDFKYKTALFSLLSNYSDTLLDSDYCRNTNLEILKSILASYICLRLFFERTFNETKGNT